MQLSLCAIFAGLAIVAPLVLPFTAHASRVGTLMWIAIILACGLHLITGLSRVITLCHFGLAGVGAYSAALLSMHAQLTPLLSVACGTVVAGVVATLVCAATYRLADHYLTLATLAANEILTNVFRGLTSVTGGANGLTNVPSLSLLGIPLDRPMTQYPVVAAIAIGVLGLLWLLDRHWIGHALRASGQLESRTACLGISEVSLRSTSFIVGGMLAGLAGGLMAHIDRFVGPESFGVGPAILYLCFMVVAELGRFRAVAVTAVGVVVVAEWLRDLGSWQMVVLGAITLIAMLARSRASSNGTVRAKTS